MQISNIRYGHAYQIKLLLLLPEKGSRRESAQILSLRFLILKLLLSVDMVSRTIVGVQHTTLDEFPYFYSFIYLFLPGGIIAFSHNWKSESGIVYALPISVRRGYVVYQMENNARKKPISGERQTYS